MDEEIFVINPSVAETVECLANVRWVLKYHQGEAKVLQQLWKITTFQGNSGYVSFEWRDVPCEKLDD